MTSSCGVESNLPLFSSPVLLIYWCDGVPVRQERLHGPEWSASGESLSSSHIAISNLNLAVLTMSPPTACHRFVQRVTNAFLSAGGHDSSCLAQSSVRLIHAKPGLVRLGLTIGKHNVNRLGSLHGGLICTLTDTMGSLALASRGLYSTGVSTDISTTFVKAAGVVGDEVHAEGRVISLGK